MIKGISEVDEFMFIGESFLVFKEVGFDVIVGIMNYLGVFVMKLICLFGDNIVMDIVCFVEDVMNFKFWI